MNYLTTVLVTLCSIALTLTTQTSYSQCSANFHLDEFTVNASSANIAVVPEVSGLTYNDNNGAKLVISDDEGHLARQTGTGSWQTINVNWSNNHTCGSKFTDVESITYIKTQNGVHTYAIAHERYRIISFLNIPTGSTNVTYSINSFVSISGLSTNKCGGEDNQGIEGIAYDAATNSLYLAKEHSGQIIYKVTLPSSPNGQTLSATQVINLQSATGLNTFSSHGLDVLPNGNLVAVLTIPESGSDNGLFARQLVEVSPCGTVVSKMNVEPTIPNSAELEGVASVGDDIYITGEYGVIYQLQRANQPGSITVNNPTASSIYNAGSSMNITWSSSNVSGDVSIELYQGQTLLNTIASGTANDGLYSYNIPASTSSGSNYFVIVKSDLDNTVVGASSGFKINALAGSITVTSPSQGDTYFTSDNLPVYWSSSNITGNVRIELMKGSVPVSTLASSTANDGIHNFTVPNTVDGTNYRVRVTSVNNPTTNDLSANFTIVNPGYTVTSPGLGAAYSGGGNVSVNWTSNGVSGNVKLELFKGNSLVSTLSNSTGDDGSASAGLPDVSTTASDYRIKISNVNNPSIFSFSNNFTIAFVANISVLNPGAGDSYAIGGSTGVSWTSNVNGPVKIELYKTTALVATLQNSTTGDGSQSIIFPANLAVGSDYSIKISNISDNGLFAFSGQFSLVQSDYITVISPDASSTFVAGSSMQIQWSDNIPDNVKIELFENNNLITVLNANTPSDETEIVMIPGSLQGGDNCVVRISSIANQNLRDDSQPFRIEPDNLSNGSPDIVISNLGNQTIIGDNYVMNNIVIGNTSIYNATSFSVAAYASTDPTITTSDSRIGTMANIASLASNSTQTISYNFDISSLSLSPGTYYVGVFADDQNSQPELSEDNNSAAATLQITIAGGPIGNCIDIASTNYAESFESGIGAWNQLSSDEMDWTRKNGGTPSYSTGPGSANDGSYYLYTEASNGNKNKEAILISPCFDLVGVSNAVMTFDYHMNGSTMGMLQVFIVDKNTNQSVTAFTEVGNQGSTWQNASINLGSYSGKEVYLKIVGTTGYSYRSDMAIDNFRIQTSGNCNLAGSQCEDGDPCTTGETFDLNCNCTGGIYTDNDNDGYCVGNDSNDSDPCMPVQQASCQSCTQTVGGSYTNGFDSNAGDWSSAGGDNTSWIRQSGATPSARTGPSAAYEGSHYMFIESSGSGYPYKIATMVSPCIDVSSLSSPTLSFAYHMYGATMGRLKVSVINSTTGQISEVFNENGNKGNQWFTRSINLSSFSGQTIQILIEGRTGFSYRSDLAVDDIRVTNSSGALAVAAETRSNETEDEFNFDIQEDILDMVLYPNPARDYVNISIESSLSGQAVMSISNQLGQTVSIEEIQIIEGKMEKVANVSSLIEGLYYITIRHNNKSFVERLQVIN